MEVGERPKKLRLLALHGGGTNAGIFRQQLQMVARHLPEVEFVYLDGPIVYDESFPIDQNILRVFPNQVYRYWFKISMDNNGVPVGFPVEDVRNGINYIVSKLQETGPIDGVIGFSQGAIAATMLVALCEAGLLELPPGISPFKFCVLFSPSYFGWIDTIRQAFPVTGTSNGVGSTGKHRVEAFSSLVATAAALYAGEEDPALQRFHDLHALCVPEAEKHIHPGSHMVPIDPNSVETIRVFLEKAAGVVLNKPPPRPLSARPQSARASRPGSARPMSGARPPEQKQ